MPNYREGVQTKITFELYATDGSFYTTSGTPPTLKVQKNKSGAPATATGTLAHEGSGLWSYIPAAGEVSATCTALHLTWSGSGIQSGGLCQDFENDFTPTVSGRVDAAITTRSVAGDAMALTGGERTTLYAGIWANGTRTLTSFGTLVADTATAVWAAGTRSLTTFGTVASDVWAVATRTLTAASDSSGITTLLARIGSALTITAGKVDVNDKTGFSLATAPLDAAGTRTALGLAGANLDTQLSAIGTKTTNLPADPASNTQINTRLPTAGYTAPDNAGIAAGAASAATAATQATAAAADALAAKNRVLTALPNAASGTNPGLPLKSDLPAAAPTVGAIADAVWDEVLSGHATTGSAGAALEASGGAGASAVLLVHGPFELTVEGAGADHVLEVRRGDILTVRAALKSLTGQPVNLQGATLSARIVGLDESDLVTGLTVEAIQEDEGTLEVVLDTTDVALVNVRRARLIITRTASASDITSYPAQLLLQ